jgi:hypothetical protein
VVASAAARPWFNAIGRLDINIIYHFINPVVDSK